MTGRTDDALTDLLRAASAAPQPPDPRAPRRRRLDLSVPLLLGLCVLLLLLMWFGYRLASESLDPGVGLLFGGAGL